MNKTQWIVLGCFFILMEIFFITLDSLSPLSCGIEDKPLDVGDVWCVINAEIFDPFIWLLFPSGVICFILSFLEPKKKQA